MYLIELALARALKSYAGKTDLAGHPYILHPLRLMAKLSDPTAKAVALLHDVLEDDPTISADDLLAEGFSVEVVEDVQHLTRRKGESYAQFIERICPFPRPRAIKKLDLEDNMDVLRLGVLTEADLRRINKYHRAWWRLDAAEQQAKGETA